MATKKKKTIKSKLTEAVYVLYIHGFISQFERDSFKMRFKTIKK
jgi:hypothetical protein